MEYNPNNKKVNGFFRRDKKSPWFYIGSSYFFKTCSEFKDYLLKMHPRLMREQVKVRFENKD